MSENRSSNDLAAWNRAADTYASQIGVEGDLVNQRFEPFLERHLGDDLSGLRILDLGCGHGWLAAQLHARGAEVVGVDGSAELLEIASQRAPGVTFVEADLAHGLPAVIETDRFDRVVSNMVVMDLPDLAELGASLRRCVKPRGTVVVTLLHPAFWNQSPVDDPDAGERYRKVTGYLEHEEWWVTSFGGHRHYHRPLSYYVDWLTREGFAVIELSEPPVPWPTPPDEQTDYEKWLIRIPTMMGLAFTTLDRQATTTDA